MNRNAIVVAVIVAVMSIAGVAGSAENSTGGSFYEGVWSGEWDIGRTKQDVTITIGEMNEKGVNKTTYDYGWGATGAGGEMRSRILRHVWKGT